MSNLIKIEIYKLLKTKMIYVVIILSLLFSFLVLVTVNKKTDSIIMLNNNYIYNEKYSEKYNNIIDENIMKNDYYENNNENNKLINLMNNSYTIIMFVSMLIFYVASSIYSDEVKNGTISNYISKPYSRYKIYLSKLIVLILLSLFVSVLILVENSVLCSIFTKTNILKVNDVFYKNNELHITNYYILFTIKYLTICIPIIFNVILTYTISHITKSKSLSLILSILIFIFSPVLSTFLFTSNLKIIQYTFIPYLDFNSFLDKASIVYSNGVYGISLNILNGIIILLVYSILFILFGLFKFKKEEY